MKIEHVETYRDDVLVNEYYKLISMKNDISSDFSLTLTVYQYNELVELLKQK